MSDQVTRSDTLDALPSALGLLAPGFRLVRGPRGELRVVGYCVEMSIEAAIETGFLIVRPEDRAARDARESWRAPSS